MGSAAPRRSLGLAGQTPASLTTPDRPGFAGFVEPHVHLENRRGVEQLGSSLGS